MQFWRANTIRLVSTLVPGVLGRVGGRVNTTASVLYRVVEEDNAIPLCWCFAWGLQTTILWSNQAGSNKRSGLWYGSFQERKAAHGSWYMYMVQTKPWVIYGGALNPKKHMAKHDTDNVRLNGLAVYLPGDTFWSTLWLLQDFSR